MFLFIIYTNGHGSEIPLSFIWMFHINTVCCDVCKSNEKLSVSLIYTNAHGSVIRQSFICMCHINTVTVSANPMKNSVFLLFTRMRMVQWIPPSFICSVASLHIISSVDNSPSICIELCQPLGVAALFTMIFPIQVFCQEKPFNSCFTFHCG